MVEDCVEFIGPIPDAALWEIMSTADACVNLDRANDMNDKSLAINVGVRPRFVGKCETREAKR